MIEDAEFQFHPAFTRNARCALVSVRRSAVVTLPFDHRARRRTRQPRGNIRRSRRGGRAGIAIYASALNMTAACNIRMRKERPHVRPRLTCRFKSANRTFKISSICCSSKCANFGIGLRPSRGKHWRRPISRSDKPLTRCGQAVCRRARQPHCRIGEAARIGGGPDPPRRSAARCKSGFSRR